MALNIQETHITCIEEMPKEWMLFDNVYTIVSSFAINDGVIDGIGAFRKYRKYRYMIFSIFPRYFRTISEISIMFMYTLHYPLSKQR